MNHWYMNAWDEYSEKRKLNKENCCLSLMLVFTKFTLVSVTKQMCVIEWAYFNLNSFKENNFSFNWQVFVQSTGNEFS